ncbi:unnamed protein product [Musa acuminata var. zebrina]
MSATGADTKPEEGETAAVAPAAGEVLYCGGTNWDMLGRMGDPNAANLVSPTRLRPLVGVDIRLVASGCRRMCVVLISKRLFFPTRLRSNAAVTLFSRFAHISKRLLSLFVENDAKKAPSTVIQRTFMMPLKLFIFRRVFNLKLKNNLRVNILWFDI